MSAIILKQPRPQKATIFGISILIMTLFLWYYNLDAPYKISFLFLVGFIFLGYSISYEIRRDFDNRKRINFFGVTVFKSKLTVPFPEYISLFSGSFKKANEWGAVAALGTESKNEMFVLKFFKGKTNKIIYKSNDYKEALAKSNALSLLLKVRIHNAVKNSST
tara:strand:+ start:304328 stop:304816 length:489 start_codon:yes stop_codon:yes gene_type:complete